MHVGHNVVNTVYGVVTGIVVVTVGVVVTSEVVVHVGEGVVVLHIGHSGVLVQVGHGVVFGITGVTDVHGQGFLGILQRFLHLNGQVRLCITIYVRCVFVLLLQCDRGMQFPDSLT